MPSLLTAIAIVALVALVESSPLLRLPLGLLLAIVTTGTDAGLLPVTALGAVGVMLARLTIALQARSAARSQSSPLRALGASLTEHRRMTFLLAAAPGPGSVHLFRLIGSSGGGLGPALAGTVVGRIPVLVVTTTGFSLAAQAVTTSDAQAAMLLGVMACLLVPIRLVAAIDWQHRSRTGEWRMQRATSATSFGQQFWDHPDQQDQRAGIDDPDVIDGHVIEVIEDDDSEDS